MDELTIEDMNYALEHEVMGELESLVHRPNIFVEETRNGLQIVLEGNVYTRINEQDPYTSTVIEDIIKEANDMLQEYVTEVFNYGVGDKTWAGSRGKSFYDVVYWLKDQLTDLADNLL